MPAMTTETAITLTRAELAQAKQEASLLTCAYGPTQATAIVEARMQTAPLDELPYLIALHEAVYA